MATLTIDEAQGRLREVLAEMLPGEELVLTDNGLPLARLVREQSPPIMSQRPPPGLGKGSIIYMAPDFDAPLPDDFWLGKLNQFGGNFVNAEMVKAFITSTEYVQRFGLP